MNINDLLGEIKLGKKDYQTLIHLKDIYEDFYIEEGNTYFRSQKRLSKIINKLEKKDVDGMGKILEELKRVSKILLPLEKRFILEDEIRKSEARTKMIEIKKSYDKITSLLRDKGLTRDTRDKDATTLVGEAVGTLLFSTEPIQEIAETTLATSLKQERIPFAYRVAVKQELNLLKKAKESGVQEFPIR